MESITLYAIRGGYIAAAAEVFEDGVEYFTPKWFGSGEADYGLLPDGWASGATREDAEAWLRRYDGAEIVEGEWLHLEYPVEHP